MGEGSNRLTGREYAYRVAKGYLYLFAPALALLFVVQLLLGNETHWQILFMPAGFAWFGWLGTRRFAPKTASVEPTPPRLELKAPRPRPGQCPVCGLADLDERAVGDELLGDTGTALARVVPYGPDRAHSECAAVVPYVAPARSTSGGTRYEAGGYVRPVKVGAEHCPCSQCRARRDQPFIRPDARAIEASKPKRAGRVTPRIVAAELEFIERESRRLEEELRRFEWGP